MLKNAKWQESTKLSYHLFLSQLLYNVNLMTLPVGGSFFRARKEDDVDETYESGFYPVLPRWNLYLVVSINMQ